MARHHAGALSVVQERKHAGTAGLSGQGGHILAPGLLADVSSVAARRPSIWHVVWSADDHGQQTPIALDQVRVAWFRVVGTELAPGVGVAAHAAWSWVLGHRSGRNAPRETPTVDSMSIARDGGTA